MKREQSLLGRALAALARREMSQAELRRRLLPYAEDADEVERVLADLKERGWQSDERFAESFVHGRQHRYGRLRLAYDLGGRGVDGELIRAHLPDRDSERRTACAVLRKKYREPPQTPAEKQKAARFLAGRGFDADAAYYALRHAWQADEAENWE